MQCRIDRRNTWTDRLSFELLDNSGVFVTLTYSDEFLPNDFGLHKEDVQKFFKRLRQNFRRNKIKYYVVGEYGTFGTDNKIYPSGLGRPHYHAIIVGMSALRDRRFIQKSWPYGFTYTLPATIGRIRYTLKYMDKQVHGDQVHSVYGDLQPPFSLISQGIGLKFLKDNQQFISDHNGYFSNGRLRPVPRYYKDKLGVESNLPNYSPSKRKRLLDYMDKYDCDLNTALNRLGMANEIYLKSQINNT